MPKVYDCFSFLNELDLLELRLETIAPYVDYFVINECDSTHTGIKKEFLYEQNKQKFAKFADKIIYVKNYNSQDVTVLDNIYEGKKREIYDSIVALHDGHKPEHGHGMHGGAWCRQFLHTEYMKLGLDNCNDDDIIMVNDLDEIPNPEVLKNIKKLDMSKQYCLLQDNNNYYVNNIASTNWRGTIICTFAHFKNSSFNMMRHLARQNDKSELNYTYIGDGGWHLSYMLPLKRSEIKLQSCAHQEFNNPFTINNLKNNLTNNRDPLGRDSRGYTPSCGHADLQKYQEEVYFDNMKVVKIDEYLPDNMVKLIEKKFPYLIKEI